MSVLDIELQDMLVRVPKILQTLLQSSSVTVKTLRLVSKEVGRIALTAVTQCEVHLDQENRPSSPLRLARLIAVARLQKMTVTIRLVSDPKALNQCQKRLASQMLSFVTAAASAVAGTTHLTLFVIHPELNQFSSALRYQMQRSVLWVTWDFSSVFKTLAQAAPDLSVLRLRGPCLENSLSHFGSFCPKLTSVKILGTEVELEALQRIGHNLPQLTAFSFTCWDYTTSDDAVSCGYTNAMLAALSGCIQLAFIRFRLCGKPLVCTNWALLPTSVQDLQLDCHVGTTESFTQLIKRVPRLTVRDFEDIPFNDLSQILRECPALTSLRTFVQLGSAMQLFCKSSQESVILKERLQSGMFHLGHHKLHLVGTSLQVRDTLAWLPQFPQTSDVAVLLKGDGQVSCLEGLAWVFPCMSFLSLAGDHALEGQQPQGMDLHFFQPLATCPHLYLLDLSERFTVSTEGLIHICCSIPHLRKLKICHHNGIDVSAIRRAVSRCPGRSLDVFNY